MANVKIIFNNSDELLISDSVELIGISSNSEQHLNGWVSSSQFIGITVTDQPDLQISDSREFAEFCLNCQYFYVKDNTISNESDIIRATLYSVNSIHKIIDID